MFDYNSRNFIQLGFPGYMHLPPNVMVSRSAVGCFEIDYEASEPILAVVTKSKNYLWMARAVVHRKGSKFRLLRSCSVDILHSCQAIRAIGLSGSCVFELRCAAVPVKSSAVCVIPGWASSLSVMISGLMVSMLWVSDLEPSFCSSLF